MKALKTIFYLISIPALLLILSSCGTKPVKKDIKITEPITDPAKSKQSQEQVAKLNAKNLEKLILEYKQQKQWSKYLITATELWTHANPSNQLSIEYQIWQTLKEASQQEHSLQKKYQDNIDLVDWFEFIQTTKLHPINQKQSLKDSQEFNPHALFNAHLSDVILKRLNQPTLASHIAILLPLSGNYRPISLQIRNGIIKNKLLNHPDLTLRFYDSSNAHQIDKTYQTAIKNGADFVIGPVKKETIQFLSGSPNLTINQQQILTLNDGSLPHFSYKSKSEALQIVSKLKEKCYKNIAVLSSSKKFDTQLSQNLLHRWLQDTNHQITVKTYPKKRPNLRKALASVINEKQSSARKNNLRWLLQKKLYFTPRPRQDLDALVLLGNANQVAVFKPQLNFFNLDLPIYSSSSLTPAKLKNSKPNKDLRGVNFLTYPAVKIASNLTSKLEAFGWDSLTIVTHQHLFAPKTCLNKGMTGRLTKDDTVYDHQYQWMKYNRQGIIQ